MNETHNKEPDERDLQQLLQSVGSRISPPPGLMDEVRTTVHEQWRAVVAERALERSRRRRTALWGASIAASVLVAAVLTLMMLTPAPDAALVARLEGQVMRDSGLLHWASLLAAGERVQVGDEVSTAGQSRVAFSTEAGVSFRLDKQTHVQLIASDRLLLKQGAVYVDADPRSRLAAAFAVDTRSGTIRHIGTQYEVREAPQAIEVSIREGRVAIDKAGVLHAGAAGERIVLRNDGQVHRSTLPEDDTYWQWVQEITPLFDIENQPLSAFLLWYERETGREVEFASPELSHSASEALLRGSIEGLEPDAALSAVLATAGLMFTEHDGKIVIAAQ